MALKDWKKVKSIYMSKNNIYCFRRHTSYISLPNEVNIFLKHKTYMVSGTDIDYHEFKLKSQALKFAKSYMRKH